MSVQDIEKLYRKPYINLPFPIDKSQIEEAMNSFFDFLELPEDQKNHIGMKISSKHRRGDVGFRHRDSSDDIYNDSKDFFHYHPVIDKEYAEFINSNPVVKRFIQNASPIWSEVYKISKNILMHFEQSNPGTVERVFGTDVPHILLRFLRYDYTKAGLYLAKPHFDAGSFTMAIAESGPGLRIGTNPDDLEPVVHKENNAIFFVSSNYKKILDDKRLKPAWHDVIQVDESKIDKSFSRWAMVAFIEGHSIEALTRKETHKFAHHI